MMNRATILAMLMACTSPEPDTGEPPTVGVHLETTRPPPPPTVEVQTLSMDCGPKGENVIFEMSPTLYTVRLCGMRENIWTCYPSYDVRQTESINCGCAAGETVVLSWVE